MIVKCPRNESHLVEDRDSGFVHSNKFSFCTVCREDTLVLKSNPNNDNKIITGVPDFFTPNLIRTCLDHIDRNHQKKLKMTEIPLNDPKVFDNFRVGNIDDIFLFNNPLMT